MKLLAHLLVLLSLGPFVAKGDEPAPPARLAAFAARLKELEAAGRLSKAEATELYELVAGALPSSSPPEPVDLESLAKRLKAAVTNGEMTEAQATAAYKRAVAGAGDAKRMTLKKSQNNANDSFYSIVIGRLKSKDIELGEFTLQVNYVTSIYGDRSLKDTILGKTVKVVGVSGPWIDKLLLIKRGETLKLRSGTLHDGTLSLSPKATVLERAAPFDPETYPIPPETFRGFRGVVTGTIESKSDQGYELTLRVEKVASTMDGNAASKPTSIEGRLMNMQGFYNGPFREKFADLRIGDKIRVGAAHRVPEIDALEVIEVLETTAK